MMRNQFRLLQTRRFLPLFITQFLGAFNDNVFKNAVVILITYGAAGQTAMNRPMLVTLAAGVFILPFLLFSALAGEVADKFDNARLARIVKLAEIVIMLLAAAGLFVEQVAFLLAVLFLLGTQAAFFGPIKYGILPYHLREDELVGGNALIESGTFVAILTGTLLGGILIARPEGAVPVSVLLLLVAVGGWTASLFMPPNRPAAPHLGFRFNIAAETWATLRHAGRNAEIFESIIAIAWFWYVGATFLAQLPAYTKNFIRGDESVVTLFLSLFSVGIGIGSLMCNRLLKGRIHATYVPPAAFGISLFTADLFFATGGWTPPGNGLAGIGALLSSPGGWRILADLFLIAVFSGIYTVPLYALLQWKSDPGHRARVIAANNIMGSLFMTASAAAAVAFLASGLNPPDIFLITGTANLGFVWYTCRLLPAHIRRRLPFAQDRR